MLPRVLLAQHCADPPTAEQAGCTCLNSVRIEMKRTFLIGAAVLLFAAPALAQEPFGGPTMGQRGGRGQMGTGQSGISQPPPGQPFGGPTMGQSGGRRQVGRGQSGISQPPPGQPFGGPTFGQRGGRGQEPFMGQRGMQGQQMMPPRMARGTKARRARR